MTWQMASHALTQKSTMAFEAHWLIWDRNSWLLTVFHVQPVGMVRAADAGVKTQGTSTLVLEFYLMVLTVLVRDTLSHNWN